MSYGTPLAADLKVFRAFRDRVLGRYAWGQLFTTWYYENGPNMASWLKGHDLIRGTVYVGLVAAALPLKAVLFGHWSLWVFIFGATLAFLLIVRKKGWRWTTALVATFAVAFAFVIAYFFLVEAPVAQASYSEGSFYYYASEHIGRPFSLRDASLNHKWYE